MSPGSFHPDDALNAACQPGCTCAVVLRLAHNSHDGEWRIVSTPTSMMLAGKQHVRGGRFCLRSRSVTPVETQIHQCPRSQPERGPETRQTSLRSASAGAGRPSSRGKARLRRLKRRNT